MLIHRKMLLNWLSAGVAIAVASPSIAQIQKNDLVLGLSFFNQSDTLEHARGPASANGGAQVADTWTGFGFQQGVEFDNFGGIKHNRAGNLLTLNVGTTGNGGSLVNFATNGTGTGSALIADAGFSAIFGHVSRIAGLSVAPNNSKIAFSGGDSGRIYVMNYVAGATPGTGAGASVTVGVNSNPVLTLPAPSIDSSGTTWIDNDTVATFDASIGKLMTINAATGADTTVTSLGLTNAANHSSLAYEPSLSPYLYVMWGSNNGTTTTNTLYVFNPANNFATTSPVASVDFSTSINTAREIAFDSAGNLYLGQFHGGAANAAVDVIPGLAALAPAAITANSSIDWYNNAFSFSFSGLDVASSIATLHPGDFDQDGDVDGADFVSWQTNFPKESGATLAQGDADGDGDVDGADFVVWQTNFPFTPGQGASPVPEPATWLLLGLTLPALAVVRRRVPA
jgi:hypothetical protein